ncbi:hypothetical protein LEP1GSC065_3130 [Leptospira kirschneri serovar Sokoine str. RM1]|nr:hypothetical protein LEP1GSC065_3130 [Leptospira kirschneri serovar Sokoine str. RM1]
MPILREAFAELPGSRWKLNTTLSYGSRCGAGPIFLQRICRNSHRFILELLKNSIVQFNKTISIARFHEIETDGEFIFQQLY